MWARQRQQITLNCGKDLAMAKALAAAQDVYDGANYNQQLCQVSGSNGFSLMSYGDSLTISVVQTSDQATVLNIYSKAVWGFVDFGHNKKLVRKVVAFLEELESNVVDLRPEVIDLDASNVTELFTPTVPPAA